MEEEKIVQGYGTVEWECPKCNEKHVEQANFTGGARCDKCGQRVWVTD